MGNSPHHKLTIQKQSPKITEMEKPKQLENVKLEKLKTICQDYIDFVDNDKEYHEDNDYEHYIFEVAMETIFGKDVWEFVNNRH